VGACTLGAGFGCAPTHFAINKIVFLSRNLDQNMPKNGLFFLEKIGKNRRSVAPKPPLASGGWCSASDPELLFSYVIATSKSYIKLLLVEHKNILPPEQGYRYPSYVTGNMTSFSPSNVYSGGATAGMRFMIEQSRVDL